MTDRRVQVVAVLVVLVALAFGGWGLYEVGRSHGARDVHVVGPSRAETPAARPNPVPNDGGPGAAPPAPDSGSQSDIVHATRTGKRYHAAGCRYLSKSDIPMTRQDAEARGLTPCSVCRP